MEELQLEQSASLTPTLNLLAIVAPHELRQLEYAL
jgi:hypothetical protein